MIDTIDLRTVSQYLEDGTVIELHEIVTNVSTEPDLNIIRKIARINQVSHSWENRHDYYWTDGKYSSIHTYEICIYGIKGQTNADILVDEIMQRIGKNGK